MSRVRAIQSQLGLTNDIKVDPGLVLPTDDRQLSSIQALRQKVGDLPVQRKAFHPSMMPPRALPQTCLVDVDWDHIDPVFRYRVWGTGMRDIIGEDLTGKTVMEFPRRSCRVYLMELFSQCARTGQLVFSAAAIEYQRNFYMDTEKLFIPMVDNQGRVDKILTLFTFDFRGDPLARPVRTDEPEKVREYYSLFPNLKELDAQITGVRGDDLGMGQGRARIAV